MFSLKHAEHDGSLRTRDGFTEIMPWPGESLITNNLRCPLSTWILGPGSNSDMISAQDQCKTNWG